MSLSLSTFRVLGLDDHECEDLHARIDLKERAGDNSPAGARRRGGGHRNFVATVAGPAAASEGETPSRDATASVESPSARRTRMACRPASSVTPEFSHDQAAWARPGLAAVASKVCDRRRTTIRRCLRRPWPRFVGTASKPAPKPSRPSVTRAATCRPVRQCPAESRSRFSVATTSSVVTATGERFFKPRARPARAPNTRGATLGEPALGLSNQRPSHASRRCAGFTASR